MDSYENGMIRTLYIVTQSASPFIVSFVLLLMSKGYHSIIIVVSNKGT